MYFVIEKNFLYIVIIEILCKLNYLFRLNVANEKIISN